MIDLFSLFEIFNDDPFLPLYSHPYFTKPLLLALLDESNRVVLLSARGTEGSDYINASYIDVSTVLITIEISPADTPMHQAL